LTLDSDPETLVLEGIGRSHLDLLSVLAEALVEWLQHLASLLDVVVGLLDQLDLLRSRLAELLHVLVVEVSQGEVGQGHGLGVFARARCGSLGGALLLHFRCDSRRLLLQAFLFKSLFLLRLPYFLHLLEETQTATNSTGDSTEELRDPSADALGAPDESFSILFNLLLVVDLVMLGHFCLQLHF